MVSYASHWRALFTKGNILDASLSKIEAVQRQLNKDEQELRARIAELKDDMKKDQNTSKMHIIQEMISVYLPNAKKKELSWTRALL